MRVPRAREFRSGDFHEPPSTKLHLFLRNFTTRGHLMVFGFARFHLQAGCHSGRCEAWLNGALADGSGCGYRMRGSSDPTIFMSPLRLTFTSSSGISPHGVISRCLASLVYICWQGSKELMREKQDEKLKSSCIVSTARNSKMEARIHLTCSSCCRVSYVAVTSQCTHSSVVLR
jgi:hypothetical protein